MNEAEQTEDRKIDPALERRVTELLKTEEGRWRLLVALWSVALGAGLLSAAGGGAALPLAGWSGRRLTS